MNAPQDPVLAHACSQKIRHVVAPGYLTGAQAIRRLSESERRPRHATTILVMVGPETTEAFNDLLFAALDHGIDSVREGGPLIPFVMSAPLGGAPSLSRFIVGSPEHPSLDEGLEAAAAQANELLAEGSLTVLVYDGYLTQGPEGKLDAIYAEGAEPGMDSSMVVAQRYVPNKMLHSFKVVGNPALLTQAPRRLRTSA